VVEWDTDGTQTAYRLTLQLSGDAQNIYTVYGTSDSPMVLPPAAQVAAPFGTNTGGVSPAFIEVLAANGFDSWLTVGLSEGDTAGALGTVGIEFDDWTADAGLTVDNGAVFWMTPDDGPAAGGDDIVVAQIVVPTGTGFSAVMDAEGRGASRQIVDGAVIGDWLITGLTFNVGRTSLPPEPAAEPAPSLSHHHSQAQPRSRQHRRRYVLQTSNVTKAWQSTAIRRHAPAAPRRVQRPLTAPTTLKRGALMGCAPGGSGVERHRVLSPARSAPRAPRTGASSLSRTALPFLIARQRVGSGISTAPP
jgi:hypothetical protein